MWLIIGLGNPGSRYEDTPHNLGFDVARVLARRHGMTFRPSNRVEGEVAEGEIKGTAVRMLLPMTFMNLSGEAAAPLAQWYRIPPQQVLAISDDVAIPWGKLRLRKGGSHGGHNGLRNLILHLKTDDFPRVRIGCAPEGWRGDLADYVLAKLRGEPLELARHMAEIAADAVEMAITTGWEKAQNKFNPYDAKKPAK
jgi:PTH1 family peptidyl-tRNA hydrolase